MEVREFFETLDKEIKGKTIRMKEGQANVLSFGPDENVWIVRNGLFISEMNCEDGSVIGTGIFGAGSIMGITALNGVSSVVSCTAIVPTVICAYKTKDVLRLMQSNNDFHMYITKYACSRTTFLMNLIKIETTASIQERVDFILETLRENCTDGFPNISDIKIAEFIGVHPASVSRAKNRNYKKKEQENNKKMK